MNEKTPTITRREAEVFLYRFGLIDHQKHTLEETGAYFGGVSRERVRQVEARMISKMRRIAGVEKEDAA